MRDTPSMVAKPFTPAVSSPIASKLLPSLIIVPGAACERAEEGLRVQPVSKPRAGKARKSRNWRWYNSTC